MSWWSEEFRSLKIHSNIEKGGSWGTKKPPKLRLHTISLVVTHFPAYISITFFYYNRSILLHHKQNIIFICFQTFFNKLDFHQKERFCFILGKKIICTTKEQEILHRIWRLLSQSSIKQEYRALSHSVQNKEKEVCSPITTRGYLTIIETSAEFSLHGRCNLEFS